MEPLNGFAPNSHGRRVCSLARMTLKVKVKGQRSRSLETKTAIFGPFGGLRAVLRICLVNIFSLWFDYRTQVRLCFLALSVTLFFLFVYELSRERLNGFGPNSQGRRVWTHAWKSLNIKVKG